MQQRIVRSSLVLMLLVSSGLWAIATPASASSHLSPTCLVFPWVPLNAKIEDPRGFPDSGPFFGVITLQNLESSATTVYISPTDVCQSQSLDGLLSFNIPAHGSLTLQPAQIGIEPGNNGGGIVVIARDADDPDEPARIAGAQRQSSPSGLEYNRYSTSAHQSVSGYSALQHRKLSQEVVLPIVQTNSNWNTVIRATNFSQNLGTQVDLMLYPAGGGDPIGPFGRLAPSGKTASFNLLNLGVPEDWVGTAVLTASADIAAVAERIKPETNMLMMNTSRIDEEAQTWMFAPLVFRDWNHWNTGISIANLNDEENEIKVVYYSVDGEETFTDEMTIPANGMDFFYLPSGDGEDEFIGAAHIEGTQPFYGVVDEVKYFGDDPDTGHAMSYVLDDESAREGQNLAIPVIMKGESSVASGDTSGIQIHNMSESMTQVEVMFYHEDGTEALSEPDVVQIDPLSSYTAYTLNYPELPTDFVGTAVVHHSAPVIDSESTIRVISNLVNYDVLYDGAAVVNGFGY
jgi:hypothetical protein